MDARDIEKLVTKAKDDIIKEVHDRLPRKVGVVAVNHFKQNFRDGVEDPLPYADTIGCFSSASFPFQRMECKFHWAEYKFHGMEHTFHPVELKTYSNITAAIFRSKGRFITGETPSSVYLNLIHLAISLNDGFLPYIKMPTR